MSGKVDVRMVSCMQADDELNCSFQSIYTFRPLSRRFCGGDVMIDEFPRKRPNNCSMISFDTAFCFNLQ